MHLFWAWWTVNTCKGVMLPLNLEMNDVVGIAYFFCRLWFQSFQVFKIVPSCRYSVQLLLNGVSSIIAPKIFYSLQKFERKHCYMIFCKSLTADCANRLVYQRKLCNEDHVTGIWKAFTKCVGIFTIFGEKFRHCYAICSKQLLRFIAQMDLDTKLNHPNCIIRIQK